MGNPKIIVSKDGPYLVSGQLPLIKENIICDAEDNPLDWQLAEKYPDQQSYALCRCGKSGHQPFCDGTHSKVKFAGSETASKKDYLDQAETIKGPDLNLNDAPELCATTGFCHRQGGTWQLTMNSDNPEAKKTAIQQASDCPSGRLVAWDKKTGEAIEPKLTPTLSLVEHQKPKISGPIWVKGKIAIESADGTEYEKRNRVTLCRCGQSNNKPFCDGTHLETGFTDKNVKS